MLILEWWKVNKNVYISINYQFQCCNCKPNYIKPKWNRVIWQSKYWIWYDNTINTFFLLFFSFFWLELVSYFVRLDRPTGQYKFSINSEIRLNRYKPTKSVFDIYFGKKNVCKPLGFDWNLSFSLALVANESQSISTKTRCLDIKYIQWLRIRIEYIQFQLHSVVCMPFFTSSIYVCLCMR